jgi:hypothetical protein
MSRTLHARWILPFVVTFAGFALWQNSRAMHWKTIAPGVEFASLRGEPYCRMGSTAIGVLRLDPAHVKLGVRHFTQFDMEKPPGILDWQYRTRAMAVFNAGQFYPDWSYMGLLVAGGDTISARPHGDFQALLVGDRGDGRGARVIDLSRARSDSLARGWREVAQSFMLFDAGGPRVRRSTHIARRTIVAEDDKGHLLVFVSEGGYTLADFADLLTRSRLGLTQAMSMDGGLESEMVIEEGEFRYASFGEWRRDREPEAPGARAPLPAVITVEAR